MIEELKLSEELLDYDSGPKALSKKEADEIREWVKKGKPYEEKSIPRIKKSTDLAWMVQKEFIEKAYENKHDQYFEVPIKRRKFCVIL